MGEMPGPFYICDLRPCWARRWAIIFWRSNDAGYAYPLSWSGKYDWDTVVSGGTYYHHHEGGKLTRFPVPCDVVDALATAPPARMIDGDAGPVVLNTAKHRAALRKAGRAILRTIEAKGHSHA